MYVCVRVFSFVFPDQLDVSSINWQLVWYGLVLVACLAIILGITGYFAWRKRKFQSSLANEFGDWNMEEFH
jgi:hypothetical protein